MAKGSSKAGKQTPTTARAIENMNEAQLDKEIRASERKIASYDRAMGKNNITGTAEAKAMQEAFPLGVGGDGWSAQRRKAQAKSLERDAVKAKKYTEAYEKKQAEESRLNELRKAKKTVSGTGKTAKQISNEKTQKAVKETTKSLKWKTTSKGGWENGGYKPKVIKAGNIEIHGGEGFYRVFKDGKLVGQTNKLSTAKAAAERIK